MNELEGQYEQKMNDFKHFNKNFTIYFAYNP
ncbi:hypothetical protein BD780_003205 [Clostridium tetanomorphum]|nr:hypothetical protein [Clostridium tetanomorphum]NRS85980.1 hypothetical protein [Clostridium tetanomorphum]NRZ96010.1 hypothetical protein [Clostridium tetanomorphum]SQB89797.1 Uncharacterised protein [Clostridium tetanomorphum]